MFPALAGLSTPSRKIRFHDYPNWLTREPWMAERIQEPLLERHVERRVPLNRSG